MCGNDSSGVKLLASTKPGRFCRRQWIQARISVTVGVPPLDKLFDFLF
jgi:hypothetical protein